MASFGSAVKTTVAAAATSRGEAWATTPGIRATRCIASGATSWAWIR